MGDANAPVDLPDDHPNKCSHPFNKIETLSVQGFIEFIHRDDKIVLAEDDVEFCTKCESVREGNVELQSLVSDDSSDCLHPYESVEEKNVAFVVGEEHEVRASGRITWCNNCDSVLNVIQNANLRYSRAIE